MRSLLVKECLHKQNKNRMDTTGQNHISEHYTPLVTRELFQGTRGCLEADSTEPNGYYIFMYIHTFIYKLGRARGL